MNAPKTSLPEQIAEVEREMALRGKVYPTWVRNGKLSQALADRQSACMAGALKSLKWMRANIEWIKTEAAHRLQRSDEGER